jgi:hypothetical protein
MENMPVMVRVRFDGKVFVLEEPVNLPVGVQGIFFATEPVDALSYWVRTREDALRVLQNLVQRGLHGACIPDQALRRENLYHEGHHHG